MRLSWYTAVGSSGSPFRVTSWIVAPTRSANVEAPGCAHENRITVVEAKVVSEVVRSRSTV
jgi:hypothetical protein